MKTNTILVVIAFAAAVYSQSAANAQHLLTLDEAKKYALENSVEVKNAALERDAAAQVRRDVFSNYFPNVSATGAAVMAKDEMLKYHMPGGNLPVYDGNPAHLRTATEFAYFPGANIALLGELYTGAVTAVQPVFMGGRIINGNRLAALGVDVSDAKRKLAVDEALLHTEQQYWLLVSLNEKMNTVLSYESLLLNLEKKVQDAYASGIVLKNDLLKVQLKLSEVRLNKSKLENGRRLASMALCQSIGIPYDSTMTVESGIEDAPLPPPEQVDHNAALANRTERYLLDKSVEAAHLQKLMEIGENLPSVAIGVSGYYLKLDEMKDVTNTLAFATVQVPISGWWGGAHRISERAIQEEIAENNARDKKELLLLQMDKAWHDLDEAYDRVRMNRQALQQADENLKVNRDSYNNGVVTVSDLLEAQALHQETRNRLTESITEYRLKQSEYLKATGRM